MIFNNVEEARGGHPQGGGGNGSGRGPTPPDVEKLLENFKKKLKNFCQVEVHLEVNKQF